MELVGAGGDICFHKESEVGFGAFWGLAWCRGRSRLERTEVSWGLEMYNKYL